MRIALTFLFGVVIASTADAIAAGLTKRPSWLMGGLFVAFWIKLISEA